MDVLLARILKFLNGALTYDDEYLFSTFVVMNYMEMQNWTLEEVVEKSGVQAEPIIAFVKKLGYRDYDAFKERLILNHMTRLDQIRARMIGLNSADFVKDMEKDCTDEEMLEQISAMCASIDKAKRVVIIAALYPTSIGVEFQTDLVTFGKPVLSYHQFDKTWTFDEDDVVIFISATGRARRGFMAEHEQTNIAAAQTIMITQNPTYKVAEHKVTDYVIQVPGRFDGINFNYQLMKIFDLMRIHYYQQYYIA
ncbi:MAG: MurR/RpiR family transcriptional regulator [Erysipelotrichaceae bacterium]|nr:MurR/RpiR family transcriptional regulator [Erysipelotrichaceae bacterium]